MTQETSLDYAETHPQSASSVEDLRPRRARLAKHLRTASLRGDKPPVTRLMLELMSFRGLHPRRRLALRALTDVIHSLHSVAMTDELTGLHNRRGFLDAGTRCLELARRDLQCTYLVCLDLNDLARVNAIAGRAAGDALIRHAGSFLRELVPSYGIYEVLGRLGDAELAALTTDIKCPWRADILLRARTSHARAPGRPPLSLSVGLAYFNPLLPVGIDQLLRSAEQAMCEHKRVTQLASLWSVA